MKKIAGTFEMPEGRVPRSEAPDWSVNQYSWNAATPDQRQGWIDDELKLCRQKILQSPDKRKAL